jgi:hypothetical protein
VDDELEHQKGKMNTLHAFDIHDTHRQLAIKDFHRETEGQKALLARQQVTFKRISNVIAFALKYANRVPKDVLLSVIRYAGTHPQFGDVFNELAPRLGVGNDMDRIREIAFDGFDVTRPIDEIPYVVVQTPDGGGEILPYNDETQQRALWGLQ